MRRVKFQSKAFRKGFLDGFTAYYTYFRPQFYNRTVAVDPSICGAWKSVGDALGEAHEVERGRIGKTTRKAAEQRLPV